MSWYMTKVSAEETLKVKCPTCRAKPEEPCVYIWLAQFPDRAGQPTKKPHNQRYVKARQELYKAQHRAEEQKRDAAWEARLELLRVNADAARREQDELVAWLGQHAHILIGAAS